MSIWHRDFTLSELELQIEDTAAEHVGLSLTKIGGDFLEGTLPVDHRTKQTYGILHGGASALLIETLASVASAMVIDHDRFVTLGTSVQADHLRQVRGGKVKGRANPLHLGSRIHVWIVVIWNEADQRICSGKLSCMILPR